MKLPTRISRTAIRVVAVAAVGWITPALWSQVTLSPGQSIQAAVDANSTGTTFTLTAGTYRITQPIHPKAGNVFTGNAGATVNGSRLLTSWTVSGSNWYASTPTLQGVSGSRTCHSATPLCNWPDEIFYDNARLQMVTTLGGLTVGRVYIDRASNRVYIASNPSGHTVEQALSTAAFVYSFGITPVTVDGLIIEKCASPTSTGAISATSTSVAWTITDNEVRLNHAWGIIGGVTVTGNNVHHNGQMGLGANGLSNTTYSNNEIAWNNAAGYDPNGSDGEAGGTKWLHLTTSTVDTNYVHDNDGPGLWMDTDNKFITYSNNHTKNNAGPGIFHEISFDAVIHDNLSENDNTSGHPGSLYYGSGIYLNDSRNVEIYANTVANSVNGIGGSATNRGTSVTYGLPYTVQNLYVHDNTVTTTTGTLAAGLVSSYSGGNVFSGAFNNRFVHDTYCLPNPDGIFYAWNGSSMARTSWKSAGEDTTGIWTCGGPLPPTITSFTVASSTIVSGDSATLSWATTGATALSINNGIGTVTGTSLSVSPVATTTYTLTATNSSGSVTASAALTVTIAGNPGTPAAAAWPDHAVTRPELFRAADHAASTISGAISSSATVLTLSVASTFVANQVVRVDSELMKLCGVSGVTLTVCSTGGRGIAGTTATVHASGSAVHGVIAAIYHNQLGVELAALEGDLFGTTNATGNGTGTAGSGASWADHAATQAELLKASDGATGTLASSITNSSTSLTLNAVGAFVGNQVVQSGTELIKICTVSTVTLTVCAGGRGFDNTIAAAHSSGAAVIGVIAANYHNRLADELVALENDLFPGFGGGTAATGVSWPNHAATKPELLVASNGQVTANYHNRLADEIVALEGGLFGAATGNYVDLSWTASASSGITGYKLYRSTTSGGPYTILSSGLVSGTSYSDYTVTSGHTYYYVATAIGAFQESAYSNQFTAVVL